MYSNRRSFVTIIRTGTSIQKMVILIGLIISVCHVDATCIEITEAKEYYSTTATEAYNPKYVNHNGSLWLLFMANNVHHVNHCHNNSSQGWIIDNRLIDFGPRTNVQTIYSFDVLTDKPIVKAISIDRYFQNTLFLDPIHQTQYNQLIKNNWSAWDYQVLTINGNIAYLAIPYYFGNVFSGIVSPHQNYFLKKIKDNENHMGICYVEILSSINGNDIIPMQQEYSINIITNFEEMNYLADNYSCSNGIRYLDMHLNNNEIIMVGADEHQNIWSIKTDNVQSLVSNKIECYKLDKIGRGTDPLIIERDNDEIIIYIKYDQNAERKLMMVHRAKNDLNWTAKDIQFDKNRAINSYSAIYSSETNRIYLMISVNEMNNDTNRIYLVTTDNVGETWKVVGTIDEANNENEYKDIQPSIALFNKALYYAYIRVTKKGNILMYGYINESNLDDKD